MEDQRVKRVIDGVVLAGGFVVVLSSILAIFIVLAIIAALTGCTGVAAKQEAAALAAFDGCACVATECKSVSSFSGKAAAAAAQRTSLAALKVEK